MEFKEQKLERINEVLNNIQEEVKRFGVDPDISIIRLYTQMMILRELVAFKENNFPDGGYLSVADEACENDGCVISGKCHYPNEGDCTIAKTNIIIDQQDETIADLKAEVNELRDKYNSIT